MPRIPIAQVSTQVGSTPGFTAPQVTPQQSAVPRQLQQFGEGMQSVGLAGASIALQQQEDIDAAKTAEADLALADTIEQTMGAYGQVQGKAAVEAGAKEATLTSMDKAASTIERSLTTDAQRVKFRQAAGFRLLRARSEANQHEATQAKVWHAGELSAQVKRYQRDGLIAYQQGGADGAVAYSAALIHLRDTKNSLADLAGVTPDERANMVLEGTTQFHTDVADFLVSQGRSTEASAYLLNHAAEIDPSVGVTMQDRAKRGSVKEEGIAKADLITGAVAQLEGATTTEKYAAALNAANELRLKEKWPVEVFDAVQDRLSQRHAQQLELERGQRGDVIGKMETHFLDPANRQLGWSSVSPAMQQLVDGLGLRKEVMQLVESNLRSDPDQLHTMNNLTPAEQRAVKDSTQLAGQFPGVSAQARELAMSYARRAQGKATPKDLTDISDTELIQHFADMPAFGGLAKGSNEFYELKEKVGAAWNHYGADTYEQKKAVLVDMMTADTGGGVMLERGAFGVDSLYWDTPRAFDSLTADEKAQAYVVTPRTKQVVHFTEIPNESGNDIYDRILGVALPFANQNGAAYPYSPAGVAEVWVRLGRPKTLNDLYAALQNTNMAATSPPVPDPVRRQPADYVERMMGSRIQGMR